MKANKKYEKCPKKLIKCTHSLFRVFFKTRNSQNRTQDLKTDHFKVFHEPREFSHRP